MNKKNLSIVVPVYNVEKYLERCLESLIDYLKYDVEIILVDDGSKDNSGMICDDYANRYKDIHVIHKENGGLSDARNAGLDKAVGQYVWFVDSDDMVCANIERLLSVLKSKFVDVICLDYIMLGTNNTKEYIHNSLNDNVYYSGYVFLKTVLKTHEYYVTSWSYIYNRVFLCENKLYFKKGIYHEDEQLTPHILLKASTILPYKEVSYKYIVRDNSIVCGKNNEKNIKDLFQIYNDNTMFYKNTVDDVQLRRLLLNDISEKMIYVLCRYKVKYSDWKKLISRKEIIINSIGLKNKIRAVIFTYFNCLYRILFNINEVRKNR